MVLNFMIWATFWSYLSINCQKFYASTWNEFVHLCSLITGLRCWKCCRRWIQENAFHYRWYDFANMEQRRIFCVSPWNRDFYLEPVWKRKWITLLQFISTVKSWGVWSIFKKRVAIAKVFIKLVKIHQTKKLRPSHILRSVHFGAVHSSALVHHRNVHGGWAYARFLAQISIYQSGLARRVPPSLTAGLTLFTLLWDSVDLHCTAVREDGGGVLAHSSTDGTDRRKHAPSVRLNTASKMSFTAQLKSVCLSPDRLFRSGCYIWWRSFLY